MSLKARKPETVKPNKPKFLISGDSGSGKTTFALDFPKPYLIDTEIGATREQYQEKLKKAGGVYFGKDEGSQDFATVLDEVRLLATTKHEYKTLILDSFSYLYLLEAADAELKGGSEFGRDKKEANKPTRQLMRWLDKLDMNVILICHNKIKWAKKGKELYSEGNTFDGYDKMEYILDLWIEIDRNGKTFLIKKSRVTSLPKGDSMPLSYSKFAELYGKEVIEEEAKPADLSNDQQINRINELIGILSIPLEQIQKWYKKTDVDSFEEMTKKQILSLIDVIEKKLQKAKGEK